MALLAPILAALALLVNSVGQQSLPPGASSLGSVGLASEQTEVVVSPMRADLGVPQTGLLIPGDAAIDRGAIPKAGDVLAIAGAGDGAQIRAATVQPITVDVVAFERIARRQAEQFAVQEAAYPFTALNGLTDSIPVLVGMPTPLLCPCSIGSIDSRVDVSDTFADSERNERGQPIIAEHSGGWSFDVLSAQRRAVGVLTEVARHSPDRLATRIAWQGERLRAGDLSASLTDIPTGVRAEQSLTGVDRAGAGQEVAPALTADAGNGTLRLHLDSPPGDAPRAVSAASGHLRAPILPRLPGMGGHSLG